MIRTFPCGNCGRERTEEDLEGGLCTDCRREVLRRARLTARFSALAVAIGMGAWIIAVVGPSQRFTIGWLMLVAAAWALTYKIVQRVAFEVIRNRGVPPPEE